MSNLTLIQQFPIQMTSSFGKILIFHCKFLFEEQERSWIYSYTKTIFKGRDNPCLNKFVKISNIVINFVIDFFLNHTSSTAHHLTVKRLKFRPCLGLAGVHGDDLEKSTEVKDNSKDWLQLASCSMDHSVKIFNINLRTLCGS